jgi:hypothetical protein
MPSVGRTHRGSRSALGPEGCTGLANFTNDPVLAAVGERANAESGASIGELVVPRLSPTGLAPDEIVNNVRLCMSGGINEPRDGIALTIWALLTHPDALVSCQADPAQWRVVHPSSGGQPRRDPDDESEPGDVEGLPVDRRAELTTVGPEGAEAVAAGLQL